MDVITGLLENESTRIKVLELLANLARNGKSVNSYVYKCLVKRLFFYVEIDNKKGLNFTDKLMMSKNRNVVKVL